MPAKEHPISVLCDAHTIPMLMFLRENGPSRKTDGRKERHHASEDRLPG